MRPSLIASGASRLPLTPKRGNKDYYKGTRQAFAPGGGHRTGAPGAHVVRGKAKYRVQDERVRWFVGPGVEKIEASMLKPYVTTNKVTLPPTHLPSFSPQPARADGAPPQPRDFRAFSKAYAKLPLEQRQALVMDHRRKWLEAVAGQFPAPTQAAEEDKTREVEERAGKA